MGTENDQNNDQQDSGNNHPAYQHILDALPEDLHPVIVPELKKWDAGVTQKFQEIHNGYEPIKGFKDFADNGISKEDLDMALGVVNMMREKPDEVVQELVKNFDLGYVPKSELEKLQEQLNNDDDFGLDDNIDIENHPAFKALKDQLGDLSEFKTQAEQTRQQAEAEKAVTEYLETLKKEHGEFDNDYVSILIANGVDGAEAVTRYQETVNQAAQRLAGAEQETPDETPVVLGGNSSGGSGLPDGGVDYGKMSPQDLKAHVASIAAAATSQD